MEASRRSIAADYTLEGHNNGRSDHIRLPRELWPLALRVCRLEGLRYPEVVNVDVDSL
jgi:hypothetical protein